MEIKKILIILTAAMSLILPMFVGFNNAVYSSGYDTAYKITYSVYAGDSYIDGWKSGYYVDGINEMIDMLPETFGYSKVDRNVITLAQLKEFLAKDKTDNFKSTDNFNCLGFAFTLKANADKVGILSAVVTVYLQEEIGGEGKGHYNLDRSNITVKDSDVGHAMNAFAVILPSYQKIDDDLWAKKNSIITIPERRGIVFVEPQSDYISESLPVGVSLARYTGSISNAELSTPRLPGLLEYSRKNNLILNNDIIREINIFWGKPFGSQLNYGGK
jgi:hypothetical protein